MKTKNLLKYFIVAAIIGIVFAACKKKETTPAPVDNDTAGAADNSLAEGTFNEVSNISDQASGGVLTSYLSTNSGSQERGILSNCTTVIVDTTHSGATHYISINFGTSPCLCGDGKYRSGTIYVTYTGNYNDSLATHSISFSNYTVNTFGVSGTHTVTNKGHNGNGHPVYKIDVDGTITKPNGTHITWVSHRTREWTVGYNITPHQWVNDVFSISGDSHGSHSNGDSFTETCSNLKIHGNCRYIESGQLNITPSGKLTRYIDFGPTESCDANATVTIAGISYPFTMQ